MRSLCLASWRKTVMVQTRRRKVSLGQTDSRNQHKEMWPVLGRMFSKYPESPGEGVRLEYSVRWLKTPGVFKGDEQQGGKGVWSQSGQKRALQKWFYLSVLIPWHWVTLQEVTSPQRVPDDTGCHCCGIGVLFPVSRSQDHILSNPAVLPGAVTKWGWVMSQSELFSCWTDLCTPSRPHLVSLSPA